MDLRSSVGLYKNVGFWLALVMDPPPGDFDTVLAFASVEVKL